MIEKSEATAAPVEPASAQLLDSRLPLRVCIYERVHTEFGDRIRLAESSKAATRSAIESVSEYYGVGAGVGISGFRANLGVADDLFEQSGYNRAFVSSGKPHYSSITYLAP